MGVTRPARVSVDVATFVLIALASPALAGGVRPAAHAPTAGRSLTATAVEKPTGLFSSSSGGSIYGHSQLRGVLIRASWSSVEPSTGVFELSALAAQVATVKGQGRTWSLGILAGGPGTPAWLMDSLGAPWISYTFRDEPQRLALFWSPLVQERLRLLAERLGQEFGDDPALKLVYVPQMTANGIEGHLQGVDMNRLVAAGYTDDLWVAAAKGAATSFADAFAEKALAFEVHEVNGGATVPSRILDDLWNDPRLGQRVGAGMWWISGRTDYQAALISVLERFPGDIYGQVIGRSDQTSRFANGNYRTVFSQAKELGLRYLEPWEYEFGTGPNSANGAWDETFHDFNEWADSAAAPVATWIVPSSARAAGAGGSRYTTDLVFANPGARDAAVALRFLGHDTDGRSGTLFTFSLGAGRSESFSDVLGTLFGESEAYGAILVTSDVSALVVLAQTSTPLAAGTFGQSVPAFGDAERLAARDSWSIAGIREDAGFRTNLVLASAAESETVIELTLVAADGSTLASKNFALPPLGMTQLTRVVRELGAPGDVSGARLVLSTATPGASVAAYASVIDNVTNDPRTLLPR